MFGSLFWGGSFGVFSSLFERCDRFERRVYGLIALIGLVFGLSCVAGVASRHAEKCEFDSFALQDSFSPLTC